MKTQKNIFYNVLLAVSQVLFPLITFPYLARTLGPEHIGLINFAESFAKYFVILAALGIPIYGVREIAKLTKEPKERSILFWEILSINFICTIIFSLIFLVCIYFIPNLTQYKELFTWALFYFFLQMFNLEWFFSGLGKFKFIAIRSFFIRLLFILSVFVFIRSKWDFMKYMQMQVILSLILAIINAFQVRKFINFDNVIKENVSLLKHMKPLLVLFLTIFSISIYFSLDTVLLGFLADNESVGYYATALKLNKLVIAVLSAISAAMFPSIMNYFHQKEFDKFNQLIKECFFLLISLSMPLVILFLGCAPEIVEILFGSNYSRAILPLQITTPLIFVVSLSTIFGFQILSALAKDKLILYSAIYGMVISILLSFILVPIFKEIGTAIAILITELVVCASFLYYATKHYPMPHLWPLFKTQFLIIWPYILIIVFGKMMVSMILIRIIFIVILSFIWFCTYYLYINTDNVYAKTLQKYFSIK
jgi:O-antigen/teichoic acid export membrane protein